MPQNIEKVHISSLEVEDAQIISDSLSIAIKKGMLRYDINTILAKIGPIDGKHNYVIAAYKVDPDRYPDTIHIELRDIFSRDKDATQYFDVPTLWIECASFSDTELNGYSFSKEKNTKTDTGYTLPEWVRAQCAENGKQIDNRTILRKLNHLVSEKQFGPDNTFIIGKNSYYLLGTDDDDVFVRVHSKNPTIIKFLKRVKYTVGDDIDTKLNPYDLHEHQCSRWLRNHPDLTEDKISNAEAKTKVFQTFRTSMIELFPSLFSQDLKEPRNLRDILLDIVKNNEVFLTIPYLFPRIDKS